MSKKCRVTGFPTVTFVLLIAVALFSFPGTATAKSVAIEGMSYNVNVTMSDNLKLLVGKKVSVSLDSGASFSGIVKKVGNHLLHLEKLEGKDFFDALIRLEDITAIDTRFREFQR